MISISAYKIVHILGILFALGALGALALRVAGGEDAKKFHARKLAMITHGLGLVLILASGFGMLARLGVGHGEIWPLWVWLKLGIWVIVGGLVAAIPRLPTLGTLWWFLVPALGTLAGWIALYKP